jgi:hypothetical protein
MSGGRHSIDTLSYGIKINKPKTMNTDYRDSTFFQSNNRDERFFYLNDFYFNYSILSIKSKNVKKILLYPFICEALAEMPEKIVNIFIMRSDGKSLDNAKAALHY